MRNEMEIWNQLVAMMAHIEDICEEQGFIPPVAVRVTDIAGQTWAFDYDPEWDEVDILREAPQLPITVRIQDAKGNCVERRITDLAPRPEWMKPFLQ